MSQSYERLHLWNRERKRTSPAYETIPAMSSGEYSFADEYAPFSESSVYPGTLSGKLCASEMCQCKTLILVQLIWSNMRSMFDTGKLSVMFC